MDGSSFLLYDFGLFPSLLDDYGYYLIKKNVDCILFKDGVADVYRGGCNKKSKKDVVVIDKKLGVVSTIDFLHWEAGKYRIYIDTLRLSSICSSSEEMIGDLMGRIVLGTIRKYCHDEFVHDDYVIVGTSRVYRASDKQRRQDLKMVQRVRSIISGKEYLDICSSGILYPNLKANYDGIFQLDMEEKKQYQKICKQVGDVSEMWQCGVKRRQLLREQKIYSWKHPSFSDYFYDMVSSPSRIHIIHKMMKLSSTPEYDFLFPPCEEVLEKFPVLRKDISSWVFVDFETDFNKCIYLCGYYTEQDGYQCEWADHLDPGSEKPLMHKIYRVFSKFKNNGALLCYYVAEMNFWKERCRFHRMYEYMDLFDGMLDLSHVFIYTPLIIQGVYNFKLKSLASRLYDMGYISIKQPEGCMDGAQSVDIAKQYFKTRSEDLSDILERYNQFDCQVLYEIVCFLRKYFL